MSLDMNNDSHSDLNSKYRDKPMSVPRPEYSKFTYEFPSTMKNSYLKIIGRGNYSGYKDFMNDYFKHRELIALRDLNRTDRIKNSRKQRKQK